MLRGGGTTGLSPPFPKVPPNQTWCTNAKFSFSYLRDNSQLLRNFTSAIYTSGSTPQNSTSNLTPQKLRHRRYFFRCVVFFGRRASLRTTVRPPGGKKGVGGKNVDTIIGKFNLLIFNSIYGNVLLGF